MSKQVSSMTLAEMVLELNDIYDLSDAVYKVRSMAVEGEQWGPWPPEDQPDANSWDHPTVVRYGELAGGIIAAAKKARGES